MHTDHHHTYESPKQYYSIQLSHTFCNDNIVLTCTKITTAISFKKNYRFWCVIGQAHWGDFSCHLFHTKRTHWAQATPSWPLLAPLFLFPGVHLSFARVHQSAGRSIGTPFGSGALVSLYVLPLVARRAPPMNVILHPKWCAHQEVKRHGLRLYRIMVRG